MRCRRLGTDIKLKRGVYFIIIFFQLYEKLLGFSRPVEDKDEEDAYPGLPPAFHPLMDKMAEQENRYVHA